MANNTLWRQPSLEPQDFDRKSSPFSLLSLPPTNDPLYPHQNMATQLVVQLKVSGKRGEEIW